MLKRKILCLSAYIDPEDIVWCLEHNPGRMSLLLSIRLMGHIKIWYSVEIFVFTYIEVLSKVISKFWAPIFIHMQTIFVFTCERSCVTFEWRQLAWVTGCKDAKWLCALLPSLTYAILNKIINRHAQRDFKLLATDFFFFNFSTPVFKMWVIQKPNKVALWNKRHFEEKNGDYTACLTYSVRIFVE